MKTEVLAPARWITQEKAGAFAHVLDGKAVSFNEQCFVQDGQLAGDDATRATALKEAMACDAEVLWAARGGYGAMRILPGLEVPSAEKIFIGYSDMCALQFGVLGDKVTAIHGAMPIDADGVKDEGNITQAHALAGQWLDKGFCKPRRYAVHKLQAGEVDAPCYAVNLAVLCALLGTPYEPQLPDHILCLEDVGEYYYAADRLFWRLAQSRLRSSIKAIVLGDFTAMEDNEVPWGQSIAEIAAHHLPDVPMATGLPLGHGRVNVPIVQGEIAQLKVRPDGGTLSLSGRRA